jgi:CheY-like chemotaxis protein
MLQVDARRLKQMLVNLLSNAVKFTPEGGAIGLDVIGDAAAPAEPGAGARAPEPPTPAVGTPPIDAPHRRPDPARPVVLLAEDEEHNIYTLSTYLTTKGYQVIGARNGAEAVDRARDSAPALILMDIQMPGMDGLEATRRIRADPTCAQIPIIALTALAMPGDRERCIAAGANVYLSKPVSLKGLAAAIDDLLRRETVSADPHMACQYISSARSEIGD